MSYMKTSYNHSCAAGTVILVDLASSAYTYHEVDLRTAILIKQHNIGLILITY